MGVQGRRKQTCGVRGSRSTPKFQRLSVARCLEFSSAYPTNFSCIFIQVADRQMACPTCYSMRHSLCFRSKTAHPFWVIFTFSSFLRLVLIRAPAASLVFEGTFGEQCFTFSQSKKYIYLRILKVHAAAEDKIAWVRLHIIINKELYSIEKRGTYLDFSFVWVSI